MPVDKQVMLRYQVLNKCFRNRYRDYTIDDLVDECNKALRRIDKQDVSKRTIQNDINTLEADYGIMLDEKLKSGRQRKVSEERNHTTISINVKINKELIALLLSFGPDVEVISPTVLKEEMKKNISAMCYNYHIDEEK